MRIAQCKLQNMLLHLLIWVVLAAASDDSTYSTADLIAKLEFGHHLGNNVDGVPADFECSWREYAWDRAHRLQVHVCA